jgi:hypothetical protein
MEIKAIQCERTHTRETRIRVSNRNKEASGSRLSRRVKENGAIGFNEVYVVDNVGAGKAEICDVNVDRSGSGGVAKG